MERRIELCGRLVCYELERKRVKNINLRIKPDGSVRVSAPARVPLREIEDFMRRKDAFIVAALRRMEQAAQALPPTRYEDGDRLSVFGEGKILRLERGKAGVRVAGEELILTVPDPADAALKERVLDRWLRAELGAVLEEICRGIYPMFAPYGVAYPVIRLRKMKSCWGSCMASKGVVTFNSLLALMPRDCIEYVAVHEFTHFIRPDHSPEFHRLMDGFLPDWRERKKKLRNYAHLAR